MTGKSILSAPLVPGQVSNLISIGTFHDHQKPGSAGLLFKNITTVNNQPTTLVSSLLSKSSTNISEPESFSSLANHSLPPITVETQIIASESFLVESSEMIENLLEKTPTGKYQDALVKISAKFNDIYSKQKCAMNIFYAKTPLRNASNAEQDLAYANDDMNFAKEKIDSLMADAARLKKEIEDIQVKIKIPVEENDEILEFDQSTDLYRAKIIAENDKNKFFTNTQYKNQANLYQKLFDFNRKIRTAQRKLDNVNLDNFDKKRAMLSLEENRKQAWRATQLLRRGDIIYKQALKKHESKQVSEIPKIDEAMLIAKAATEEQLTRINIKLAENLYNFAIAKTEQEKIIRTKNLAKASAFAVAAKESKKIANELFKAESLSVGKNKFISSPDFLTENERLGLMAVEMHAIAAKYRALEVNAKITAHIYYKKMHFLKNLSGLSSSGSLVSQSNFLEIAGGAGVGNVGTAKASLTAKAGLTKKESFIIDDDCDINYIWQKTVHAKLALNLKFLPFNAYVDVGSGVALQTVFFERPRSDENLTAAQRFAILSENKRDTFIAKWLRKRALTQKIYPIFIKALNKIATKKGAAKLDPNYPLSASKKIFTKAAGSEHVRLVNGTKDIKIKNLKASNATSILGNPYDISLDVPLSEPAVASDISGPKATKYPMKVFEATANAEISLSTKNVFGDTEIAKVLENTGISAGIAVQAETGIKFTKFKLQNLNPASITAAPDKTGSLAASDQLVTIVFKQVWEPKLQSQYGPIPIPEEYFIAQNLFLQSKNKESGAAYAFSIEQDQQNQIEHLKAATTNIGNLGARLTALEALSSQLVYLHKYQHKSSSVKAVYNQKLKQLSNYQLPKDLLDIRSKPTYTRRGLVNAIGTAWKNIDMAAMLTNQSVISRLGISSSTLPQIALATALYDEACAKTIYGLRHFNGPLTEDGYLRYAVLQSNIDIGKIEQHASLNIAATLAISGPQNVLNNAISDSDNAAVAEPKGSNTQLGFKVKSKFLSFIKDLSLRLGVNSKIEISSREQFKHSNPIRAGNFKIVTTQLSFDGIARMLVANRSDGLVVNSSIQSNALAEIINNALDGNGITAAYTQTTSFRNSNLQFTAISSETSYTTKLSTPDILSYIGVGGSLSVSNTEKEIQQNTVIVMGPDPCFNILQAPNLRQAGFDESVINAIRNSFIKSDMPKLKQTQQAFFNAASNHQALALQYFGGNAIDGLLEDFSAMDCQKLTKRAKNGNLILDDGFELFSDDVAAEYQQMQKAASKSPLARYQATQSGSNNNTNDQAQLANSRNYICAQMGGLDPVKVSNLLQQKLIKIIDSTNSLEITAADFLKQASFKEKIEFYQNHPLGVQLFAAYVLIVTQGNAIRSMYMNSVGQERTVSPYYVR